MGLDFASLVLGPCMDVFADPIVFTPTKSQPTAAPYLARGVYALKQVKSVDSDGLEFIDQQPTLGIRLVDYLVPPAQGDSLVLKGVAWNVNAIMIDGQGGADLVLKQA